jgi:hypothetical protein
MKNLKIIQKMAIFFAVASTIFVVLSAIDTYYLLQIASPDAPIEYVAFVIAATSSGVEKESLEKEAPTPAKPTE